jgi:CRP-like cAMP-binding protein
MFRKILKTGQALAFAHSRPSAVQRIRTVEASPAAEQAAELLTAPGALLQLTPNEARVVVSYMRPKRIAAGTQFMREGDDEGSNYMLLVLDGEVEIETVGVSRTEPLVVSVVGPGHIVGEMGMLDGGARSANCRAASEVRGAMLTRAALSRLTREDPLTACKLLMAISHRMAVRLRLANEKLRTYATLTQTMQQELMQFYTPAPVKRPGRPRG